MRKNGSRYISINQYRSTDLFVFALILTAAEMLTFFSAQWFPAQALFTFSLMVPVILTVMMRWGWIGAIYAPVDGLLWCLFSVASGINGRQWAVYIIGNAFLALMLIPIYLIGRDKITKRWWACALLAIGGWLCVYLGRSVVWAIAYAISPMAGTTAGTGFLAYAAGDSLSLAVALIVVLVLRRLSGMFENQKTYLRRIEQEKREKMRVDQFGENLGEIDEETFKILNKDNDLF